MNAASSFYATTANTNANANANTNNTHMDRPAALKRVGTPWLFSHVIGGSFSFSPMGDDDDDGDNEGKDKKKEEGEGEFREGEEPIGKSSGIKLKNTNGSVPSTSNSDSILPGLKKYPSNIIPIFFYHCSPSFIAIFHLT